MLRWFLASMGIVTLAFLGCKSGSGGGGSSGVSSSKKVSEATAQDLMALCNAHKNDQTTIITGVCTAAGIGTGTQAMCEQAKSKCVSDAASTSCSSISPSQLTGCSATIGDVEACLQQMVNYFSAMSCSMAGQTPANPPACYTSLSQQCSSVLQMPTTGGTGTAGAGK